MKTFIKIIAAIVILLFAIVTIVIINESKLVFLTWACVSGLWGITIYLDLIQERYRREKGGSY